MDASTIDLCLSVLPWAKFRKAKGAVKLHAVLDHDGLFKNTGVSSDHSIILTSQKGKAYQGLLRKIGYRDPITNKQYYFLTNNFKLAAKTIADIYKDRWQIELFFKWVKQNLKIKSFIGTTKNAVMSQIWVALCTYLLIYYFKWSNGLHKSALQIIQLLQLNWFDRRCVVGLFKPPKPSSDIGGTMDLDL